ncbi:MAG TPA: hypothetical protein VL981_01210 [Candidatus Methylacidiphilales bacterium]|nr:hypothetical protein [Candidatus Methylacidiphilales bacterium]
MRVTRRGDLEKKSQRPGLIVAAVALLLIASAIRIWAAQNDLWLDEIWSIDLVSQVSSPWQIFYAIHSDNNHYLNALWIYFCGFRGNWSGYRIPSIVAGIGSVVVAGLIGLNRSMMNAVVAMFLIGFSYVLILYSSEARGYSALIFFSFLCYYFLERYLRERQWPMAFLFSLSACLGLLAHLEFLTFFFSSFLWAAYRLIKSAPGWRDIAAALFFCYTLPALLFILLYWIDVRHMVIAGGDHPGLANCYETSLAWALGMPSLFPTWVVFGVAMLVFIGSLYRLWSERPDLIVFFASVVAIMPILLAWAGESEVLYVRYFIVSVAFFALLMSFFLSSLCWSGRGRGKILCGLLLAGYLMANGWHIVALLKYGRGNNGEALRYVLQNSNEASTTIGGDQDFRIGVVVDFYNRTEAGHHLLQYATMEHWPTNGVEWLICEKESYAGLTPPARMFADNQGHQYELVKIFPTGPLSGLHWFIYHRRTD